MTEAQRIRVTNLGAYTLSFAAKSDDFETPETDWVLWMQSEEIDLAMFSIPEGSTVQLDVTVQASEVSPPPAPHQLHDERADGELFGAWPGLGPDRRLRQP